MSERITVEVDAATCEGNVECLRRLPDVFLLDDHEGQAVAVSPQPFGRRSELEEVVAACPTRSIRLVIDDAGAVTDLAPVA